jgi:serine protease DegQ
MKKAALYSSSRHAKAPPPARAETPGPEAATAAPDAPSGATPSATAPVAKPPGRLRRLWRRYDRPLLVLAGALFAVALVAMHAKMRPGAYEITQKDIDAAVLSTLENTPLPSVEAKAYAAILPSVVRVVGIGPEEDDDEKAPDKGAGKAPGSGKGKFVVPGQPPEQSGKPDDKLAGGGKGPGKDAQPNGKGGEADKGTPGKDGETKPGKRRSGGVGTGVVIVDKGIILTNLHVVAGAQKIMVTFFDGMEAEAVIIGMRPEHDLAVLQAKSVPDDMQAATLRSTADLQIGDHVVAVGFPFGIGPSASAGVVSGLKREYQSPEGKRILTNLIQFDAAANPGNSGGPLVTADGEVVGIVTGILNPTSQRVFIGIGFAVPIENAAAAVGMSPF